MVWVGGGMGSSDGPLSGEECTIEGSAIGEAGCSGADVGDESEEVCKIGVKDDSSGGEAVPDSMEASDGVGGKMSAGMRSEAAGLGAGAAGGEAASTFAGKWFSSNTTWRVMNTLLVRGSRQR